MQSYAVISEQQLLQQCCAQGLGHLLPEHCIANHTREQLSGMLSSMASLWQQCRERRKGRAPHVLAITGGTSWGGGGSSQRALHPQITLCLLAGTQGRVQCCMCFP